MIKRIKDIYEYRDMISSLVRRELKGRYKGSILGILWTYVNPLCQVIIYSAVFSVIFKVNIDKFYLYLVIGMMPWTFFGTCVQTGAICLRMNSDMIKKIYFPREVIPISFATSAFVNMLFSMIIVFLAVIVSGYWFNFKALLFLPIVMMLEYVFALGMTFLVSSVTVYFRDMEQIVGLVMMAWIYVTPIMYNMEYVPEKFRWLVLLNPMTSMIEMYHQILYYRILPAGRYMIMAAVASVITLAIGVFVFTKLERRFAEEL